MRSISSLARDKETEALLAARLRLLESAPTHSLEDLLRMTLDELEVLTNSRIGFFHFMEPNQETLTLRAWSTRTLRDMCKADGKGRLYNISEAGVWADCIRQRRTLIHNDYPALPLRKGLPPGHAAVLRELVVPVFRGAKIVAIVGVGNKPKDYTEGDVRTVMRFADLAWDITEWKRADENLRDSEWKYRIVADNTYDWEWWKDAAGTFVYISPSCLRITHHEAAEFISDPDLLLRIILPEDRMGFLHHQDEVEPSAASGEIEFRISRPDGSIRWIAHVCQPALDAQGRSLGRRGSNRDITDRKRAEEALRVSERSLRALSFQLMTAQETERRRISRELHDDLGGTLAVLKLRSSRMKRYLTGEPAEMQDEFRENLRTIDQLIDDVRRISRDLSPSIIEDLGLTSALKKLMNDFVRDYRIPLACDLAELGGGISLHAQVMIYRVFQELLTNIGKHAQARNVSIRVGIESGELVSVVEDDGKGFDHRLAEAMVSAERGMGLTTMKERVRLLGGSLELKSEIGQGTRIAFQIPIDRKNRK